MLITFLEVARVAVPVVVFLATLNFGTTLGMRLGANDYTLSWHAYITSVYWLGVPLFPAGSWLIMKSLLDFARAAASRQWPTTRGKILANDVAWTYVGRGMVMYGPKVSYRYSVAGRDFENNAIQIARTNFSDREKAKKIASRYPTGADIEVRYDPADPSDSVLDLSDSNARRNLGLGLLMVAVPFLVGAVFVWHNSR